MEIFENTFNLTNLEFQADRLWQDKVGRLNALQTRPADFPRWESRERLVGMDSQGISLTPASWVSVSGRPALAGDSGSHERVANAHKRLPR